MTFKNQLNEFKKYKELFIHQIVVADEVEQFDWYKELNDEEFEIVCDFIYDWYMHSDIYPYEACGYVNGALFSNKITITDLLENRKKATEVCNSYI